MAHELSVKDYVLGIEKKDRAILAKAITLIESNHPDHQKKARALLKEIMPLTGKAKRIGISGTPGVGKSTFIENFGMHLIDEGFEIAILAIDPTSQITGGSILGDKTRMQNLATSEAAFIRPSPNGNSLGGVASKTREAMLLCDAYGFDIIFIETVGVGQSEMAVANIVDFFILLMQPGSGDELQGIKRGILEVSDLVIVNKADGKQLPTAKIAQHDYKKSLEILQEKKKWETPVLLCSSTHKTGFEAIEKVIKEFFDNFFDASHRILQTKSWLKDLIIQKFKDDLAHNTQINLKLDQMIDEQSDLLEGVNQLYQELTKS